VFSASSSPGPWMEGGRSTRSVTAMVWRSSVRDSEVQLFAALSSSRVDHHPPSRPPLLALSLLHCVSVLRPVSLMIFSSADN
jgi:hypothetical protein